MTPSLADGLGAPDQGVATFLLVAAVLFGWVFIRRVREKGFLRLPQAVGWLSGMAAVSALVLAVILPPIIRPPVTVRPRTSATIDIERPRQGAVYRGDPARVPVRVRVVGGKIVRITSTHLVPDEGHVHLFLDGRLLFMAYRTEEAVPVPPGRHRLQAEFVAVDHGPFDPRVLDAVSFTVRT
jgi:hypothetical protein